MLQRHPPLDEQAVADTVAAVFAAPEFNRGQSIWSRILAWWREHLPDWLFDGDVQEKLLLALATAIVLSIVARVVHEQWLERRLPRGFGGSRALDVASRDPWALAQELASRGEFTLAAHALYAALLDILARRDEVRVHPSKTVGDYLRELRSRAPAAVPTVRDFARSYEVVAYGDRTCDAERYYRLHRLATSVIDANG